MVAVGADPLNELDQQMRIFENQAFRELNLQQFRRHVIGAANVFVTLQKLRVHKMRAGHIY